MFALTLLFASVWEPGACAPVAGSLPAKPATIIVHVDNPDAVVSIEGQRTQSRGTRREYQTPPLALGKDYQYRIEVDEQEHLVTVHAGGIRVLDARAPNFGVDCDKLSKRDRLCYGGREIDPKRFFGSRVPDDDSRKPYICVIGDDAFHAAVKQRLAGIPEAGQLVVGFYSPDDWHVTGVGYRRAGVSILGPRGTDGKAVELHYQADPDGLGKAVVQALRKIDPSYDPTKTPDLRKDADPLDVIKNLPTWAWAVGGLILFLLLRRNNQ
jgi:uncharacterized protein (TIGR03000 family)